LADVPKAALAMLQSVLPTSLGIAPDRRDRHQQAMVGMLEAELSKVAERLQKTLEETEAMIAECEASKEEMSTQMAAKGEEINTQEAEVLAKKRVLAQVARAFHAAREAVEAARDKCTAQEADTALATLETEQLTAIITTQLRPLADGSVQADEMQSNIDQLMLALTPVALEESMTMALPSVLAKAPTSRAAFDSMVLSSVEGELQRRVEAAEARIAAAQPAKAALAKVLEEAEAALVQVDDAQLLAAETFTTARTAKETLEEELQTFREGVLLAKDGMRKCKVDSGKAKAALAKFCGGPHTTFATLRDAKTECVEPEASVEDPASVDAEDAKVDAQAAVSEDTEPIVVPAPETAEEVTKERAVATGHAVETEAPVEVASKAELAVTTLTEMDVAFAGA